MPLVEAWNRNPPPKSRRSGGAHEEQGLNAGEEEAALVLHILAEPSGEELVRNGQFRKSMTRVPVFDARRKRQIRKS